MDEEFTKARLFVSKVKSEVKTMAHRAATLETRSTEMMRKLELTEKELSDSRLLVQQV